MKFILPLILLSFTVTLTNAQSGEDFTKTKTIQAVRGFRDQLNYNSRVQQKLLSRINTMINTTKSLSDPVELQRLRNYFLRANEVYAEADERQKDSVSRIINEDLTLKMDFIDANTSITLGVSPDASFGVPRPFKINAQFISGNVPKKCRIYWANYLGGDRIKIIYKNAFDGSSSLFKNPYEIELNLPGYITFWLKDLTSQQVYKSDFVYKKIVKEKSLDVVFIPINQ